MDYSRQESLISVGSRETAFHIIGCGGIGSWVALFLAKAGCRKLYLWDGDVVEQSNLHRTPYRESHVGVNKAQALREILLETFGEHTPHSLVACGAWEYRVPISAGRGSPRVICAVDGMKLRQQIQEQCAREGIYYIDVGAEADGGNISDSAAEWELETAAPREYFTPIWIAPCVVIAALTVWCLLRQPIWDACRKQQYPYLRFDEKLIVNLLAGRHFEETGQAGTGYSPIRNVSEDEEAADFEDYTDEEDREEAPF